jgi:hypothetical protein
MTILMACILQIDPPKTRNDFIRSVPGLLKKVHDVVRSGKQSHAWITLTGLPACMFFSDQIWAIFGVR